MLAAAGLLNGRRATTHWNFCDQLQATYPSIKVEAAPIYVRDGRLWTSAGVTAGIDLALALLQEDLGRERAMSVARFLVVFVRRAGGQSQFSAQLAAQAAERIPIRDVQAWVIEHPHEDLSLPTLARRAAMSVRHFSRVFHKEIGVPPATFVERVRVEVARRILETTPQAIDTVAMQSGFRSSEVLRRAFARQVGVNPREYRARFGDFEPLSQPSPPVRAIPASAVPRVA